MVLFLKSISQLLVDCSVIETVTESPGCTLSETTAMRAAASRSTPRTACCPEPETVCSVPGLNQVATAHAADADPRGVDAKAAVGLKSGTVQVPVTAV